MIENMKKWFTSSDEKQLSSTETEFLPAVLEVTETPPSPVGRVVMISIMVLLAVGLLWSFLGHVDEMAVANGKIIPIGQVKTIQAEDKGVVKEIHVKEGQTVKKGDVLIDLDRTISEADLANIRKQIAFFNLEIARLTAQKTGQPFVVQPNPDLDPKDLAAQQALYQSWLVERQTHLAASQSNIEQSAASVAAARAMRDQYDQQLQIAREQEVRTEALYRQNAVSYFQYLEYRAKRMQLEQSIVVQTGEIAKNQAALEVSRNSSANASATYDKEADTKLTEDRKQLLQYTEELKKADEKNRLAHIVAPVDGRVGQLAVHTVGGVVTAAQPLMIIVPDDATLAVEAWVANKDIGFIKVGQEAEVKVDTFNFQKYGTLQGVVSDISPDAVSDERDKERDQKYRVLLTLDKDKVLVSDEKVPLGPGMAVAAEIKIRQKRIIEFFLDPFRKYQSEALRER